MRSDRRRNSSVTSPRNWWSGLPWRVGSRSWARREPSPSKYLPMSSFRRKSALSRRFSSNRSLVRRRSLPSSPRKRSSVCGSRPSPSPKLSRRVAASASAARSCVACIRSWSRSNSAFTTSALRLTPVLHNVSRPMRSARSISPARSASGVSRTKAARAVSVRTRLSRPMVSPVTVMCDVVIRMSIMRRRDSSRVAMLGELAVGCACRRTVGDRGADEGMRWPAAEWIARSSSRRAVHSATMGSRCRAGCGRVLTSGNGARAGPSSLPGVRGHRAWMGGSGWRMCAGTHATPMCYRCAS